MRLFETQANVFANPTSTTYISYV